MAKPRTPNQRKTYGLLNNRLAVYVKAVEDIYDRLSKEAASIALDSGYKPNDDTPFSFADFPETKNRIERLQAKFASDMRALIYSGISEEWANSNTAQDLLANRVLKAYGVQKGVGTRKYYRDNTEALEAFKTRVDNGMNLSQKLWQQSVTAKEGLEAAISTGVEKGMSAVTLSKRVSQYLKDFSSLRDDYKERFGTATDVKDCEYRSMRLARSEINMAYRTAEQLRWKQMDFILGYEIKLSGSHPKHDICDELAGRYPKDFVWTGWHPNDICYVIPIVMTDDEWYSGKGQEITDVPQNYKDWCLYNSNRILEASEKGTLPYFIKDNYSVTIDSINSAKVPISPISSKDIDYLVLHGYIPKENYGFTKKILLSDSVEKAQERIEDLFARPATITAREIAEQYAERNAEINILLSSIDRLTGVDGITKLKTINRLKDLCAKETVKDLVSWNYVDGLTYRGVSKNIMLSSEQYLKTKNGTSVFIPETRIDIVVFRDSYGKDFAYPIGAHKKMFSASTASEVIQEYPPYFRRGIKRVTFLDQVNPYDAYWKVEYNNQNHVSMASDGNHTTFYMTPQDRDSFKGFLAHEGGHILDGDSKHRYSSSKEWLDAVAADNNWYKSHGLKDSIRVSSYAKTSNSEDFAESIKAYLTDHEHFKTYFPNRAACIRKIAQKYSKY